MDPAFFPTPAEFRAWFEKNHDTSTELLVGFYKKGSGKPSITWPEAVDQALCFGWIDGVRRSIDGQSYSIRFTPRKPRSTWSAINIKRARELTELGHMRQMGIKAFDARSDEKSAIYAYEQRGNASLDEDQQQQFQSNQAAWDFFQSQPAWYRRNATWWVISAKKNETRQRRLEELIDDSAHGRTIRHLTRPDNR